MKYFFIFLITICFSNAKAQTPTQVIDSIFEALNSKNHELFNELCLEDMQLHSLALGEGLVLSSQTREGFVEGIKSIPEETIIFEEILSQESMMTDHLAQFSLPYKFYVNGQLSHQGTNVIILINTQDGWKISYIADTRFRD